MGLEYDKISHCHCSLTLNCGREILLEALYQAQTYRGRMMGTPTSEINEMHIEWTIETAKSIFPTVDQPFLIDPPRRAYFQMPGDMDSYRQDNWIPEWLPTILCIGDFESHEKLDNYPGSSFSSLTVVWFQDDFAPPLSDAALEQIKAIDWNEHAVVVGEP